MNKYIHRQTHINEYIYIYYIFILYIYIYTYIYTSRCIVKAAQKLVIDHIVSPEVDSMDNRPIPWPNGNPNCLDGQKSSIRFRDKFGTFCSGSLDFLRHLSAVTEDICIKTFLVAVLWFLASLNLPTFLLNHHCHQKTS